VYIATANSAQHGFDRAESRLAALEADFHRTTSELTREVQALLAEVRQLAGAAPRQLGAESPAWPLEGVTRLHQQLRESGPDVRALPAAVDNEPADPLTPSTSATDREPPAPGLTLGAEPTASRSFSRPLVIAIVAVVVIAAGAFAWRLQRDVRAAAAQAEQSQLQSRIAEAASRDAAVKQDAADRELIAARDLATRAQTIGDVLAAPDLQRYTLVSPGSLLPAASGQVLWSRSRGFVFTASGLPVPPPDRTYQVWLVTRGGPVSAATFVPDAAGRVTVTATLNIPRPVVAAIVTNERKDGSPTPTGDAVLARLPVPVAAPAPES
jgi:hypothetical protein